MVETVIIVFLIVLLFAIATAPLEALEWWADWFEVRARPTASRPVAANDARCYVVYLTGIAGMDTERRSWREQQLLEQLHAVLPDVEIISDIFPYSMQNEALTGQRLFRRVWRFAQRSKLGDGTRLAGLLINARNILQIAVAADHRYGPIYNRGSAQLVYDGLQRHGYDFDSTTPIFLIGYSGGGQIALGAVSFLNRWTPNASVTVVTLGSVFSSNRGILAATRFYHIVGKGDNIGRFGHFFFPRRWALWRSSHWNRAVRAGKVRVLRSNATAHSGRGSYMDPKTLLAPNVSNLDETVAIVAEIVNTQLE